MGEEQIKDMLRSYFDEERDVIRGELVKLQGSISDLGAQLDQFGARLDQVESQDVFVRRAASGDYLLRLPKGVVSWVGRIFVGTGAILLGWLGLAP